MTLRTNARAKMGSMPLETPAMMEMVPVGAMVVRVALRTLLPLAAQVLSSQLGKTPRSRARSSRGLDGLLVDEAHDLVGQPDGLVGVVADAQFHQHVGPAHDPQPDLAVALGHDPDLGERVAVHVDDVVEEVHGGAGDPAQPLPVDARHLHHERKIDRAEVAAFVGQERLLTAIRNTYTISDKGMGQRLGQIEDRLRAVGTDRITRATNLSAGAAVVTVDRLLRSGLLGRAEKANLVRESDQTAAANAESWKGGPGIP